MYCTVSDQEAQGHASTVAVRAALCKSRKNRGGGGAERSLACPRGRTPPARAISHFFAAAASCRSPFRRRLFGRLQPARVLAPSLAGAAGGTRRQSGRLGSAGGRYRPPPPRCRGLPLPPAPPPPLPAATGARVCSVPRGGLGRLPPSVEAARLRRRALPHPPPPPSRTATFPPPGRRLGRLCAARHKLPSPSATSRRRVEGQGQTTLVGGRWGPATQIAHSCI